MIFASIKTLIPFFYCALFSAYLWVFIRNLEFFKFARVMKYGTLTVHLGYFLVYGISVGYMPLAGKAEFLSLTALALMVVYTSIEKRLKQIKTGVFFTGIAFVLAILGAIYPKVEKHSVLLENPTYGVHVLFMLLGVVSLAVGAIYSTMFLLLDWQLKRRDLGLFFKRLPALFELGRMSRIATIAGGALLTVGVFLGYFLEATIENLNLNDDKIMMSNFLLIGYFFGFIAIKFKAFSAVKIAVATLIWFLVLVITVSLASHSFS